MSQPSRFIVTRPAEQQQVSFMSGVAQDMWWGGPGHYVVTRVEVELG